MGSSVFFPGVCPICVQETADRDAGLCPRCRERLHPLPVPRCPCCGGALDGVVAACSDCLSLPARPWAHAVCVYPYHGPVRETIHQLKYYGQTYCAQYLGRMLARTWRDHGRGRPDAVVPVPLHWRKQLRRGYNQAELLGRAMANDLDLPLHAYLARRTSTRQQARLSLEERQQNVRGCFKPRRCAKLQGTHIVVIDDVFTTGATLAAAAESLLDGGAACVSVATLARG